MTTPLVPVDNRAGDWPRKVAGAINSLIKAVGAGEVSRVVTGTVTPNASDYLLLADASGGAVTVNLPSAVSSARRKFIVKKTDASANAVTVDANGAETIDGATTVSTTTQYDAFTVLCDGSAWYIV